MGGKAIEPQPRGYEKVLRLVEKGVEIPNPLSLDIDDDVRVDRVSGKGVTLYPGCRIYGAKTVISAGVKLGAEGPVTIDNCRLGPKVELKGGYFKKSVFLEKANMGLGAQVREACLLEEEANGAHCVGLKQTILFPFVTLGSLINLCDCLMAGGTSRKDHSEVGSSYIHFNFTPDGNKTTASLFGDVPRGVMLNQRPIFLGGQGGAVGPVRLGYGTVVAAGSILRDDIAEDGKFIVTPPHPGAERDFVPHAYKKLGKVLGNNLVYMANLVALEQWYMRVRRPFFEAREFGTLMYEGALDMLVMAKEERTKRLLAMVERVPSGVADTAELCERVGEACTLFDAEPAGSAGDAFVAAFQRATGGDTSDYVESIQGLSADVSAMGVQWLQEIVDTLSKKSGALLGSMDPFATIQ